MLEIFIMDVFRILCRLSYIIEGAEINENDTST